MISRIRHRLSTFHRRQEGAVTVEFSILCVVFLLLVFGLADLCHGWYMKQVITNASREGARYGTRYQTDGGGNHVLPGALSPSIASFIQSNYASLLPPTANMTVNVGGPGLTSGSAGDNVVVTVNATKIWFFLSNLVPSLGSSLSLSSTTVMTCE